MLECTSQRFFWSKWMDRNSVSKFNTLYEMTPFFLPPLLPSPSAIKSQHSEIWGGSLKSLNKNKIASSHELSFLQTRKRERGLGGGGGWRRLQNKIVPTFKSAHPVKFPSFSLFLSLLFLNLASEDKGSQKQYRLYLHNPKCQNVDVFFCT